MKRLLATTAIATSMAFAGAGAFAQQTQSAVPGSESGTEPDTNSLLHQILSNADEVQLNVLNAAENLANLNAQININEATNLDALLSALTADVSFSGGESLYRFPLTVGGNDFTFTGTLDEVTAAIANPGLLTVTDADGDEVIVDATGLQLDPTLIEELPSESGDFVAGIMRGISRTTNSLGNTTTAIDFFEPAATVAALQTTIGDLSTTAIGALNTGVIGEQDAEGNITRNVMHLVNQTEESIAQTTGSLAGSAVFEEFGNMQFSNVALNAAEIVDGSVNIDQLMANIDGVSTTVIGALNTGDIATDINTNAAGITMALVGG